MNREKRNSFFNQIEFDRLYTQDEIGKMLGKNRHYVSPILAEKEITHDSLATDGKTKKYWGNIFLQLIDEGAFDKFFKEEIPETPKPMQKYIPKNMILT